KAPPRKAPQRKAPAKKSTPKKAGPKGARAARPRGGKAQQEVKNMPSFSQRESLLPSDSTSTESIDINEDALRKVDDYIKSISMMKNMQSGNPSLALVPYEEVEDQEVKTPPGFLPSKKNYPGLGRLNPLERLAIDHFLNTRVDR
ncbi:hypothetical protein, partial [Bartonella sp. TT29SHDZB]|uniref:hypothetical protein n=1 Tax=Bartonella sp. TT29SHDZB TaxID=3243581 RepID=UPI0035CFDEC5